MTALLEDGTHGAEDVLASELLVDVEFDTLDCALFVEVEFDAELKTSTHVGQILFVEEVTTVEEF